MENEVEQRKRRRKERKEETKKRLEVSEVGRKEGAQESEDKRRRNGCSLGKMEKYINFDIFEIRSFGVAGAAL